MKRALAVATLCALAACGGEQKTEAPPATPTAESTATPTAEPSAAPAPEPAPKSLYDRMNGDAGIAKFVDDALAGIKADKRVARYLPRDAKKLAALHDDLASQIGAGAGGPASTRKDPRIAVKAMKIKPKDFDMIVEDVGKAAGNSLGAPEAKEVVDALTGMKDDLTSGKK